MSHVIVGTAGHIDHGKSLLVRALTGTDPDRLPEEKNRGITIDLGYAFFAGVAAIIDVPGHEKFIRNMVAGAATVDFALLVVAADDGVMSQTTEHLHILRLLGIQKGAIVVTKIDKVDDDWLSLVTEQIREAVSDTFLNGSPVFQVDSLSGHGISLLRDYLQTTLSHIAPRSDRGVLRLPIDRVFTVKGRGTVVTGSMLAGTVQQDQKLTVLPGSYEVRAKHLESEGADATHLEAGQRAAVNLTGQTEGLERGLTLTTPNSLTASTRLRVRIELLPNTPAFKERQRIRFLISTQEVIGRLQILNASDERGIYAGLLLEEPVVACWGDHFIVRRYSPLETLGGGNVLEHDAPPFRARDRESDLAFARALDTTSLAEAIRAWLTWRSHEGVDLGTLSRQFGIPEATLLERLLEVEPGITKLAARLFTPRALEAILQSIVDRLTLLHDSHPDTLGFAPGEIRTGRLGHLPEAVFGAVIEHMVSEKKLVREGGSIRLPEKRIELSSSQKALVDRIRMILAGEGFTPSASSVLSETLGHPKAEIERVLVTMEKLGMTKRLGLDLFFDAKIFQDAIGNVRKLVEEKREVGVGDVAQSLRSSRKYVVPFLEHLDALGITQRSGNLRVKGRNFDSDR
jgi:selenocysteine-specific elongation factor